MKYSRQRRIQQLDFKATIGQNDGLYGIVRFSTEEEHTRVIALCVAFEAAVTQKKMCINTDSYFFYGTLDDLAGNYRRDIPTQVQQEARLDRGFYCDHLSKSPLALGRKDGFYTLPLEKLNLTLPQRYLVEQRFSPWLEEHFPGVLHNLIECRLTGKEDKSLMGLRRSFQYFPAQLRADAQQQGCYYRLPGNKDGKQSSWQRKFSLSELSVVKEPLGIIPSWVKEYF